MNIQTRCHVSRGLHSIFGFGGVFDLVALVAGSVCVYMFDYVLPLQYHTTYAASKAPARLQSDVLYKSD